MLHRGNAVPLLRLGTLPRNTMTEPAETTAKSRRRRWPQGYDPQGTRRALVDSSLHLFEQEGFDRTTLQQIVDGANLTKGAFYHHFQSKEDVLWQIQNEYLDTQIKKAARAIVEQHSDIADQLRALIRAQPQWCRVLPRPRRDLLPGAPAPHR
ncbi:TetR/AcrR family transcriptional regulator [Streptomyces cathayae]|uniref:TetR/AcrR family transcriptional regulator n=1 Tax=Streptomyces cathayae TaxID=3031124 RepID=UPI003C6FCF6E